MKNKTHFLLFIIAAGLRLVGLAAADFWYDENFTVILSRLPFGQMISATAGDTHPPLYYALTWLISHTFGDSEIALRLPSALLSLAGIWIAGQVVKSLGLSERVQLITMGLMVFSPLQIHFAQEARMYTLLQVLVLSAVWGIINRRAWTVGLCNLGILYLHNYGVFYIPVLGIIFLIREWWQGWIWYLIKRPCGQSDPWLPTIRKLIGKSLFLGFILPGLVWLPWFYFGLLQQMEYVNGGYWIEPINFGSVIYCLYMLQVGFGVSELMQPLGVLVIMGLIAWSNWRTLTDRPTGWKLILVLAWGPLALAVATSLIWKPVLLFRGLIGSAFGFILMFACSLEKIRPRKQLYAAVMVVPVLLAGMGGYYLYNPQNKGSVTDIIQPVREAWQPGDVVYHINDGTAIGWGSYAPDLPQYKQPPCEQRTLGELTDQTRTAAGIIEREFDTLGYFRRAWVVWSYGPTSSPCEAQNAEAIIGDRDPFRMDESEYVMAGIWLIELDDWQPVTFSPSLLWIR